MAGSAAVLEDGSGLSRLDQNLFRLERVLALLSGLAVFSLLLLAVVSVLGRNLVNAPLPGYVDWIEQAMPLIAFMAIAYTQRDGGHIRMDILVGRLSGRALWAAEFLTTLAALVLQIALGGWTTANYAAVVCTELPVCEDGWTDHLNFEDAFVFWGHEHDKPDYEFGVLQNDARTTIHVMHRFGALLVTVLGLLLVGRILLRARSVFFRNFALTILGLLTVQIGLGISNVVFAVPLAVAVAHNFGAVVLLVSLVLFIRAINVKCAARHPQSEESAL